ncbi:MAG TPA: tRNA (adenosine(37)-N6)-threonylcarbamoyltransferase complex dimerization subunit type 1 TsaB, partial [Nannocystaceae bacterium]|nr:tRNA (adenosine(37)-N6)-threonylcarbamoyltransferase complex dimerization subunit type 1 TsaB [Nannocystaceae bacterium]
MITLALDTTTAGSVAVLDESTMLVERAGRPEMPHAMRLPGDLLDALAAAGRSIDDVSLLAVAAGPGAFTGLRIGIATMQGLAFARGLPLVGISALDALAATATERAAPRGDTVDGPAPHGAPVPAEAGSHGDRSPNRVLPTPKAARVLACMDAARGEVFAALYEATDPPPLTAGPLVAPIDRLLALWGPLVSGVEILVIGDGGIRYADALQRWRADLRIVEPTPLLARSIGRRAREAYAS